MEEVLPKRKKTEHDRHLETYEKEDPAPLLMRLFKSDHFSPYIAVQYLFSEKDRDIRIYLGSKLFGFRTDDLDFYLPQLINMYITDKNVVEALRPYLESRCKEDVYFAALSLWLLESFGVNRPLSPDKNRVHGQLLQLEIERSFKSHGAVCHCIKHRRVEECRCDSNRLTVEREFICLLMSIGSKLTEETTKKEKTRRLVTELMRLNMSLPARISIPFSSDHVVLRIPPTNSCVLNSKDKSPYCMYVEVLRCPDIDKVNLPQNLNDAHNELVLRIRSSSTASLDENTSYSAPDESLTAEKEEPIEIVEGHEDLDSSEKFPEMCPDPAWDTMTMESANSEPVLHHGRMPLQPKEFGRRLKSAARWVNSKRPRRKLTQMRPHPDDPSASTMSEPWEEKRERIRQGSPYGRLPNWDLIPVIVKSGDDLTQELLAYQLLETLKSIWEEENVSLYLRPYKIVVTSPNSGLIEPVVDACSLHQIKRNQQSLLTEQGQVGLPSLLAHFLETYGHRNTESYHTAQKNFIDSCAAYSLICYFLQVKDRHNGNILIDADGHMIHIDFGFILSVSPRNLGFETSPFKLTSEMIDVIGGVDSDFFLYFKSLLLKGLITARKHHDRIMTIVEIMYKGSTLPCFRGGVAAIKAMRDRFHLSYTDEQLRYLVETLVAQSLDSLTTRLYDNFQYYTNGIL